VFQELQDWAQVEKATKPVIVKFETDWCGWCRRLTQELLRLAPEFGHRYIWFTVNTDTHPELARRFQIATVPTMICFEHGRPVRRTEGVYAHEIRPFLAGED